MGETADVAMGEPSSGETGLSASFRGSGWASFRRMLMSDGEAWRIEASDGGFRELSGETLGLGAMSSGFAIRRPPNDPVRSNCWWGFITVIARFAVVLPFFVNAY